MNLVISTIPSHPLTPHGSGSGSGGGSIDGSSTSGSGISSEGDGVSELRANLMPPPQVDKATREELRAPITRPR